MVGNILHVSDDPKPTNHSALSDSSQFTQTNAARLERGAWRDTGAKKILNAREIEILTWVARGKTSAQIASKFQAHGRFSRR